MSGFPAIDTSWLAHLADLSPSLRVLNLSACRSLTDNMMSALTGDGDSVSSCLYNRKLCCPWPQVTRRVSRGEWEGGCGREGQELKPGTSEEWPCR